MKRTVLTIVLISLFYVSGIFAQGDTQDDVHLFQTFFRDAPISTVPYGDFGLIYNVFEGFKTLTIGGRGGYPINPKFELGAQLGFLNVSPDNGDGESGISDLQAVGKYNLLSETTNLSAGGLITLPIGNDDVGQGDLNFGAFGALRHPLQNGIVLTGVLGLDFIETETVDFNPFTGEVDKDTDYESSFLIGGGVIYPASPQLNLVGELNIQTEGDFIMLSGGIDYKLQMGSRIRGGLGLGLDDGAPDVSLMLTFLHFFNG